MTRPCMGGFCQRRSACPHYDAPTNRVNPAERLCDAGADGVVDGWPVRVHRQVGEWERPIEPSHQQPAEPFDGIAA